MDIGSLLLVLSLALLTTAFLLKPLFSPSEDLEFYKDRAEGEEQRRQALLVERERLLSAIQELDFDQALGKVPAQEYTAQREVLRLQAAGVLRMLDTLPDSGKSGSSSVEADVSDDALENLIAARRRARAEKATGFCPRCGTPMQKSDRYCARCGNPL
ncbi:MAG: zinc ribbon domain-containing protein [Anaerolineae bacterium]|nr:zinc ribbon domain-containing protein [Anaerolineae bacterium]